MTRTRFFHPDELSAIREQCDWRRLLDDLGVRADVRRCTEGEFWGFSPFTPDERSASFHMKPPGLWYDWSSHASAPGREKPGGGVIELVQAIHAARGEVMKLNDAARWLVERGYAQLGSGILANKPRRPAPACGEKEPKPNKPVQTDLAPRLSEQGTHSGFVERDIGADTCRYLRCGYFDAARGALAKRIVFQIGGVDADTGKRVILSHMGRATTPAQEEKGKWRFYRGFNPSLELYNLDNLLLDETAAQQAADTGRILVVEGAFDVAKCVEAGVRNVVATFGAHLSGAQAGLLGHSLSRLGAREVVFFYDRDDAGQTASAHAVAQLQSEDITARAFDWEQQFTNRQGGVRTIPPDLQDPCDLSAVQLRWLRARNLI